MGVGWETVSPSFSLQNLQSMYVIYICMYKMYVLLIYHVQYNLLLTFFDIFSKQITQFLNLLIDVSEQNIVQLKIIHLGRYKYIHIIYTSIYVYVCSHRQPVSKILFTKHKQTALVAKHLTTNVNASIINEEKL